MPLPTTPPDTVTVPVAALNLLARTIRTTVHGINTTPQHLGLYLAALLEVADDLNRLTGPSN